MTRWKTSEPYWIIYEALRAGNIVQWPAKYVGDPVVWSLALRLGKKKTSFIRAKRYVTNVIRDTLQSLLRSCMVHVLIYELLNSNNLVLSPWYFEKNSILKAYALSLKKRKAKNWKTASWYISWTEQHTATEHAHKENHTHEDSEITRRRTEHTGSRSCFKQRRVPTKGVTWETLESINEKPLQTANKNLIEKDFQYENRNWVMVCPRLTVILLS